MMNPQMLSALKAGVEGIQNTIRHLEKEIASDPTKYPVGEQIHDILMAGIELHHQEIDLINGLIRRNTPAK